MMKQLSHRPLGPQDDRERHVSVTVHHDGSGSVSIYYRSQLRGSVSLALEDWRALRDALDAELRAIEARQR